MSINFNIPSSQSFASGDCIEVDLVANPYLTVGSSYSPFTVATGCAITTGPSLTTCKIPSSSTSSGQTFQIVVGGTAGSTNFQATLNFNNPPSQRTLTFKVSLMKQCQGSQLGQQTTTLSFATGTIGGMTLASNSIIIGDTNCVLTVKFQVGTSLTTSGLIMLQVPILYNPGDGTTIPVLDTSITSPQVTSKSDGTTKAVIISSSSFDNNRMLLTITYTATSTITSGQWVQFSVSNLDNPINYNSLSGFQVSTYEMQPGGSSALIDVSAATYSLTISSLTPTTLKNAAVSIVLTGTTTTDYNIAMAGRDLLVYFEVDIPLQQSCFLKVTFPNEIMINIDSTISTVTGDGFMLGSNILQSVQAFGSGNYVILTGCPSVFTGYSQTTNLRFSSIVSPGQIKDVGTGFSVSLATDNAFSNILATGTNQQGFMISKSLFIGGSITNLAFAPSSDANGNNIIQQSSEYTASFTLQHNLYFTSVIAITMPTFVTSLSATPTCIMSGLNVNTNPICTVSTAGNSVVVQGPFLNNAVPSAGWDFMPSTTAQATLTVKINSGTNPTSQKDAGGWSVSTYNQISGSKYLVDTGVALTSFTPVAGSLSQASSIQVLPATTSMTSSTYTFFITLQHSIPAGGQILVTIPADISIYSTAMLRSTCLYFPPGLGSGVAQTCSVSGSQITMSLSVTHSKANVLQIQFSGFQNPRTLKTTATFTIVTRNSDLTQIDNMSPTTSFTTAMTSVASVTAMSVKIQNLTNGAYTPYLVSFVSPVALINGDKIVFTLNSNIKPVPTSTVSTTLSCLGISQITLLTCSFTGTTLTVQLQGVTSIAGTYSFNLTNVTNPPSTRQYNVISAAVFSDLNGNQLMSLPSSVFVMIQTSLPANILTYSLVQSAYDLAALATYTITFKTTNPISGQGSVTIIWPSQVLLPTSSSVRCSVTTYQTFSSSCNFNSLTRTIIITGIFNPSTTVPYSGTVTVVLSSLVNPTDNRVLNGFQIATFDDPLQTYKIDYLGDNILIPQTLCNYPCETCSLSDRNYCTSCWSDLGQPFLQFNSSTGTSTCNQSCSLGYTTNGSPSKTCIACDPSCSLCVDNGVVGDKSRCISCSSGYNYSFTPQQKCMKNCSTGYYQSSPFVCNLCASNCLSCSVSASNCTSCNILNPQFRYLYDNQCIDSCPVGYINSGAACQKCGPQCLTCQNTTTTCTTCDSSTSYKYFFGFQCLQQCPYGTNPNNSTLQCLGCLQGCQLCDSRNQTICLKCNSPLLEYNDGCVTTCPAGTSVNFFGTSCTATWSFSNIPTIPYPHLMACAAMTLICLVSMIKDRRALFFSNILALWGPIEAVSFIMQAFFGLIHATYKYAGASALCFGTYIILNIAFILAFEVRIARSDKEYQQWRLRYPKSSRIIIILAAIFSFKILRLHYSFLFGFDCFKASFQHPEVFQRQIIIFTIAHFIFSNCLIIAVDAMGLIFLPWGTQQCITMQETAIISLVMILFSFIELCRLKHYLGEDQRIDYDALLNQMNETMDKKLRQDMLKQIMNHVKGNKDLKLNNRFDDLLTDMGPRRCQSMIEFGNDLDDDPRLTKTCPNSPRGEKDDFLFDRDAGLPTIDNVYAESKPADPLGALGKTFSDFDTQVLPRDFDKILSRKGCDFVNLDQNTDTYFNKRSKRNKPRGRKNQYYTQIDIEDDEEASNIGPDEEMKDLDDLDVIKEEEDLEEIKRLKKEQKRLLALKEQEEREQLERQRKLEEQERIRQQQENEERMKKERLERERQEREALEKLRAEQELKRQAELQQKQAEEQQRRQEELQRKQSEELEVKRQEEFQKQQEIIKQQQLQEELMRQKLEAEALEQQRVAEVHRQQELQRKKLEEEALRQAELQQTEEERLRKEEEERKINEEYELKRKYEELAKQLLEKQKEEEKISKNAAVSVNTSFQNEVFMNSQANLQAFQNVGEQIVQVPPDSSKRNFNENDILGDLDRDDKGNIIVLQDDSGFNIDKQGRAVNERGYLRDPNSGDIIENFQNKKMFDQQDMDERGEVPAPFCVEKFNFNPLLVKGDFEYDRTGKPLIQKGKKGELIDKKGRLVNKKGWLIDQHGNICDQNGRKKFDKKQLTAEGDFPRLFNLAGKRYDIAGLCGLLNRDVSGNLIFKKNKRGQNIDNGGRLVNEKGYLIDENGNIVDKERKKMFEKKHLKNGEFPKIFPFTKFNIKRVQGNFEMDPLGNPILDKTQSGEYLDRDGKKVNIRGYLVDNDGNVIDKLGKKMFEKEILDSESDIPKVFRTGLLKSDTASSLS